MDIMEAIKERRSIRDYKQKEVEEKKIKKVLEAGRWAPSGSNRQPWQYIVVRKDSLREKLMKAAHDQSFIGEAPVVIVVCNKKKSNLVNIGLTIQNICLQAYALGLGTCIVGWFEKNDVRNILNVPEGFSPSYLVSLGYPAEHPSQDRKPLEDLVHYEKWK